MKRLNLERGGYRPDAAGPLGFSDPRSYVALESFERVLHALSEAIEAPRSPVLLDGVEGAGKTLLLRVLAGRERWGRRRVVFSPFLHLPAEDVARWLLHLLGRDSTAEGAADAALIADVRERDGARTILLVDEIQCSPEASVRRLAELALAGRPQLVVIAAGASGPRLDRARVLLEPEFQVSLPSALPASEMEQLCDALVARSSRTVAQRAFSPAAREALLRDAAGVPGALTAALTRRARGPEETISSPLLDSVRGPEPPLAALMTAVPTARREAEKPREPAAARDGAAERPLASPAPAARASAASQVPAASPVPVASRVPVTSRGRALAGRAARALAAPGRALLLAGADASHAGADALRRAWAAGAAGLRRSTRRPAASQRWTRVEAAAASRRDAPPAAPVSHRDAPPAAAVSPRAQASNAPWLPRSEAGEAAPLPPPLVPALARPAHAHAAGRLRRAASSGAAALRDATSSRAAALRRATSSRVAALRRGTSSGAAALRRGTSSGAAALRRATEGAASSLQRVTASGAALLRRARGTGAAFLGRSRRAWGDATSALSSRARATLVDLASAARAVARAPFAGERGKATAAAALLVVGTVSALSLAREARERDALPLVNVLPAVGSAPAPETPASAVQAPPVARAAPVRVQVNARPWAYIRVDGVDVGPTPLSLVQLTPGRYEFEASFPDGRSVRRLVDITPEQRFVSMP